MRLVSRVALWRIQLFYNLDAAKGRDGRWFPAYTAHKSRSWCSRETKRGKQFYLGQQWNRIQVFLIPIYQHCLQLCPNEIVSENWHYEMMENLVGPDGSSGGDEPPQMAKTLVFEPGTLSIFQVLRIYWTFSTNALSEFEMVIKYSRTLQKCNEFLMNCREVNVCIELQNRQVRKIVLLPYFASRQDLDKRILHKCKKCFGDDLYNKYY